MPCTSHITHGYMLTPIKLWRRKRLHWTGIEHNHGPSMLVTHSFQLGGRWVPLMACQVQVIRLCWAQPHQCHLLQRILHNTSNYLITTNWVIYFVQAWGSIGHYRIVLLILLFKFAGACSSLLLVLSTVHFCGSFFFSLAWQCVLSAMSNWSQHLLNVEESIMLELSFGLAELPKDVFTCSWLPTSSGSVWHS